MSLRALIVFLAVLNLGIAAWWLLRPDAAPTATEDAPSGVARLQLLSERPGSERSLARPAPSAATATTVSPPSDAAPAVKTAETPPAATQRCLSIGPFADATALAAAQTALRPGALRLRSRETREGGGRGWRVYLPAVADRAAANAAADKLKAAGFTDLLVVGDGAEANSVALGRFSGEARAQQHATALRAAGFVAVAEPLGEVRIERWIDLAVAANVDLSAVRRTAGAAQSRAIDCAKVR
jgi:cell division septation protein DedD